MPTRSIKLPASLGSGALIHRRRLALSISALLFGGILSSEAFAQGFPASINLDSLDGTNGFRIDGVSAGDGLGISVAAAGDVNGDGLGDLIVGAYASSSYVVFGQRAPFAATLPASSLNGSNGFRLDGGLQVQDSGTSVSSAGDFNGDGFADLIVGAPFANLNGNASGSSYLVFGKATSFGRTLALSGLNGSDGFRLDGAAAHDQSGASVSTAGDINGDGLGDVIVGAEYASSQKGSSYLVFGQSTPVAATMTLSDLNGSDGFRLDGISEEDRFGGSVGSAGDFNGDGLDDLIIGAHYASFNTPFSGSSYAVFGQASPFPATLMLASLDGSNGFRLDGVAAVDLSGTSVSAAGDINGDGLGDVIVGADGADPNGSLSGSSYVVFGQNTPFVATLALSSLNGANGFRLDGVAAFDRAGGSVSAAGDINGDRIGDLIVGAPLADPNVLSSGSSYVVFGQRTPFAPVLALSGVDGTNGFRLDGVATNDQSGSSVSAAGDVNGDGVDDLIVGASGAEPNGDNSGSSYVVFGRDTGAVFKNGFE